MSYMSDDQTQDEMILDGGTRTLLYLVAAIVLPVGAIATGVIFWQNRVSPPPSEVSTPILPLETVPSANAQTARFDPLLIAPLPTQKAMVTPPPPTPVSTPKPPQKNLLESIKSLIRPASVTQPTAKPVVSASTTSPRSQPLPVSRVNSPQPVFPVPPPPPTLNTGVNLPPPTPASPLWAGLPAIAPATPNLNSPSSSPEPFPSPTLPLENYAASTPETVSNSSETTQTSELPPRQEASETAVGSPAWMTYVTAVNRQVMKQWAQIPVDNGQPVKVKIAIAASGELLSAQVAESSGAPNHDNAAIEAVQAAAPFEPIPEQLGIDRVEMTIVFNITPR